MGGGAHWWSQSTAEGAPTGPQVLHAGGERGVVHDAAQSSQHPPL